MLWSTKKAQLKTMMNIRNRQTFLQLKTTNWTMTATLRLTRAKARTTEKLKGALIEKAVE